MKRKFIYLHLTAFVFIMSFILSIAQETETRKIKKPPMGIQKSGLSYNSSGRRDPFRNLLAGQEIKEKSQARGIPDMYIDDITLIGIVKARGEYTAIINAAEGFPFSIKIGDRLANGFVKSIEASRVVFRKTKERGFLLIKSKDIIKELISEEL